MNRRQDEGTIVRRRLRAQGLTGGRFGSASEAVSSLLAVQAQEYAEAKFSLSERIDGRPGDDAIESAFERGEILRTHVLRPTWHFVAPEDIRWLLELTAPRVKRMMAGMDRELGLDADLLARCNEVFERALEPGDPMLRSELGDALAGAGIEARGQRLGHITMHAELDGLICSGPRRGKWHTHLLLSARAPKARSLEPDAALAELSRRYFESHGPATARDCSWWSGLTLTDVRRGLESVADELRVEQDDDGTPWYSAATRPRLPATGSAFLLPTFDEAVVAYKDLRIPWAGGPERQSLTFRPIVIDGEIAGAWKASLATGAKTIDVEVDVPLDAAGRNAVAEARARLEAFARS